jgi:cytochrome c553
MCGGCHNQEFVPARVAALHPPRYEEWKVSPHQSVLDELKADFSGSQGSSFFVPSCGACHSGTIREALLENTTLPKGHEAGAIGIVCATCHDSHQQYTHTNVLDGRHTNLLTGLVVTNNQLGKVYTNQISSPLASLVDYHSTGSFATNYNPAINICGQCHNDRGASTNNVDFPPHRSSQYNMLLGTFPAPDTGVPSNQPATHALLEKQCVTCHMQSVSGSGRHGFKVQSYDLCRTCHSDPGLLISFTTNAITFQIQRDKAALDFWAASKAPPALQKYGARAWEYSHPGTLSAAGPAPTTAEQALIPASIQKARFNLYLILNEGSFGVHNGPYAVDLLDRAYDMVLEELAK